MGQPWLLCLLAGLLSVSAFHGKYLRVLELPLKRFFRERLKWGFFTSRLGREVVWFGIPLLRLPVAACEGVWVYLGLCLETSAIRLKLAYNSSVVFNTPLSLSPHASLLQV